MRPGHTKCCACHKKHLSEPEDLRFDPPNCNPCAPARQAKCIFADLQTSHACHRCCNCHKTFAFCSLLARFRIPCACETTSERVQHFDFEMCFAPQRRALFEHLNFQKWSSMWCFWYFDFEICFAPQRRALFEHLNFQKCSGAEVFCTFCNRNVLCATVACIF